MESVLQKELLRPSEVAEICGVSRNTVYRWLRRRVLARHSLGGCTYVTGAELRAFVNGGEALLEAREPDTGDDVEEDAHELLLSFRRGR